MASSSLAEFCGCYKQLWDLKANGKASFKFDAKLLRVATSLLDGEENQLKLAWLLGADLSEKFSVLAKTYKDLLAEAHTSHMDDLTSRLKAKMELLRSRIVDESKGKVSLAMFATTMKTKEATFFKETRIAAKEIIKEMQDCGISEDKLTVEHIDLEEAKYQALKWGIARFVSQSNIKLMSKDGAELRESLRAVWNLATTGKEGEKFVEYLGEDDCKLVGDILALDSKQAKRKNGEPEKAKTSDPGNASEHAGKLAKKSPPAEGGSSNALQMPPAKRLSRRPGKR